MGRSRMISFYCYLYLVEWRSREASMGVGLGSIVSYIASNIDLYIYFVDIYKT